LLSQRVLEGMACGSGMGRSVFVWRSWRVPVPGCRFGAKATLLTPRLRGGEQPKSALAGTQARSIEPLSTYLGTVRRTRPAARRGPSEGSRRRHRRSRTPFPHRGSSTRRRRAVELRTPEQPSGERKTTASRSDTRLGSGSASLIARTGPSSSPKDSASPTGPLVATNGSPLSPSSTDRPRARISASRSHRTEASTDHVAVR
jgi:hypothetical protein